MIAILVIIAPIVGLMVLMRVLLLIRSVSLILATAIAIIIITVGVILVIEAAFGLVPSPLVVVSRAR